MNIQAHKINGKEIAEVISDQIVIQHAGDALDLMGTIYYQGYDSVIIHEKNITTDFFELKNKMAGEVLQKFSNYRIRLAIVGDFSKFTSNSLKHFIYESNRGKQIYFAATLDEALAALTG
ncbi:protein of unknown function [Parapedobacter composti]|uniref:DUF4180 domain-containing protein n=1 Tax=Parapedobacter composti TaxID=623281 RepID=A0A1I1LQA2_9SPHI|nr:DUF4180 domain-containing protein [Parapedobacter composti]SFC75136.1 protein of unknown function [Parapedobacter composti]